MPSHLARSRCFLWRAPAARFAGCVLAPLLAAILHSPTPTQASEPAQANQTQGVPSEPASAPASAPTPTPAQPNQQVAPSPDTAPPPPAPDNQPAQQEATPSAVPAPQEPAAPAGAHPAQSTKPVPEPEVPPISEERLRQLLIGKDLFLRGGYLENNLEFSENGALISHSATGSYTLCAIRVTRVRMMKHKVELEGERYGLHFLGALPGEDPTAAVDRVNITPKKKPVRITIDRELVVKEKPVKQPKAEKRGKKPAAVAAKPAAPAAKPAETPAKPAPTAEPAATPGPAVGDNMQVTVNLAPDSATPEAANPKPSADSAPADNSTTAANPTSATGKADSTTTTSTSTADASATQAHQSSTAPASSAPSAPAGATASNGNSETPGDGANNAHAEAPGAPKNSAPATAGAASSEVPSEATSEAEQAQAEIAQAPAAEQPADAKSITTTHSQAHANGVLEKALDNVFAVGLDPRMMDAMPAYWKVYYQPVDDTTTAWPGDPSVRRQSAVDKKARLVSVIDPSSNEYAQAHAVAGMAEYHVVVGVDGKPSDIAVARPIGFGLDETAVESLRKATFEPAMKDGHPVPVSLDLVVEFRIYSKLTAEAAKPHAVDNPDKPTLPGPYSVQH